MDREQTINELLEVLRIALGEMTVQGTNPVELLHKHIDSRQELIINGKKAGSLSVKSQKSSNRVIEILEDQCKLLVSAGQDLDGKNAFKMIKAEFDKLAAVFTRDAKKAGKD